MLYETKLGKYFIYLSAISFLVPLLCFSFGRALITIPFTISIIFALLGGDIRGAFTYIKKHKLVIVLLLLLLSAYVGIIYTPDIYKEGAWRLAGKYVWVVLPIFLTPMLIVIYNQTKWQKIAYFCFVIGGTITAILGILSSLSPSFLSFLLEHSSFFAERFNYHHSVISSPTMSHTETGFICAFSAYLVCNLWRFERSKVLKSIYLIIFFLLSYYVLFLNTSKTSILLYIILSFLFITQKYYKQWKALILSLCLLMIAFGGVIYLFQSAGGRLNRLVSSIHSVEVSEKETSFGQRVIMAELTWNSFKNYPLGFGIGSPLKGNIATYGLPIEKQKTSVTTDPHSQILFQVMTQGVVGFILIILYLIFIFYDSFFLMRKGIESNSAQAVAIAILYYLLVESAFLHDPARYIIAYVISLFFISNLRKSQNN
ncbi:O-antigen ligase family protein [Thiotrichales bacterium 19S9-12]|nr:O-antigen ligase family protein [Thiotrichales bacterium 19S9-11]MCF6810840.1 O-antigen ligase family protein [Thiotrichales bacterium 19S9-12]